MTKIAKIVMKTKKIKAPKKESSNIAHAAAPEAVVLLVNSAAVALEAEAVAPEASVKPKGYWARNSKCPYYYWVPADK